MTVDEKKLKTIMKTIAKIMEEIENDPEVRELAEEYQRKYGTLTEEDLRKAFTI